MIDDASSPLLYYTVIIVISVYYYYGCLYLQLVSSVPFYRLLQTGELLAAGPKVQGAK